MKFVIIFAFAFALSMHLFAKDQILVLSGGLSPDNNHYSQYLQTRLLYKYLRDRFRYKKVDVMFGVGNNTAAPLIFPDVHKINFEDQFEIAQTIHGVIDNNTSATKENIIRYFQNDIEGDVNTFFLFVSDHGLPNKNDPSYDNNCIALWSYDQNNMNNISFENLCFSRENLEDLINNNFQDKKFIFTMAQCFSGGFHRLSVKLQDGYPVANHNVCGFTSVAEDTVASGCTPDASGPNYQGYERYFTEQFTGIDVVTGFELPNVSNDTILKAHQSASLIDMTLDAPHTTSEFYLREWSKRFSNRNFIPRSGNLSSEEINLKLKKYSSTFPPEINEKTKSKELKNIFQLKRNFLIKMQSAITKKYPDLNSVFESNNIDEIILAHKDVKEKASQELAKYFDMEKKYEYLVKTHIQDLWINALKNDEIPYLSEIEKKFELEVLPSNDKNFIFLLSKYTHENGEEYANRISRYNSKRYRFMTDYAMIYGNEIEREAAKEMYLLEHNMRNFIDPYLNLDRKQGLIRRIILMREELASLVLLVEIDDQAGLQTFVDLEHCEQTEFN
ncbi:MAG: hypothetical protein A2381_18485 [Bdellovibrionales bacterium RIFOXYB1_FULL_37_110]|nr:MAG: hypothetical protein A2417_01285 [Bdellovibrionales bacterium RIFOXYC1_FULL_37_79]OFZ59018.1 MAG: hypothetical protein A2381_18485 [Bdellovibrionales bacterium RIFOXYB1_FULL_37_110]OFZ65123.1 MAG: hypothetical protein A2577_04800 [Bdellovibrionales bacterium RIFOXYD1_FULL_36_51]